MVSIPLKSGHIVIVVAEEEVCDVWYVSIPLKSGHIVMTFGALADEASQFQSP